MIGCFDDEGIEGLRARYGCVERIGDVPGRKVATAKSVTKRGDAKIG